MKSVMSNDTPTIAEIRSFETSILLDAQKSNLIINVKKTMKNEKIDIAVRRAALHALRRIFTKFLDGNKMTLTSDMKKNNNEEDKNMKSKIIYIEWLHSQYHSYIKELCSWIKCDDPNMQEVAVATFMEFVSRECRLHRKSHCTSSSSSSSSSSKNITFGLTTYRQLLKSFIDSRAHDADILLQMREQIFMQPDCTYYGLMIIRECMEDCKDELLAKGKEAASNVGIVQNVFDLLRMVVLPDEEDFEMDEEQKKYPSFLVNPNYMIEGDDGGADDDDDDDDQNNDDNNDDDNNDNSKKRKKKSTISHENDIKRKKTSSSKSKSSKTSKLLTMSAYHSSYSKAWLLLLSLPLTTTQHRLVLRHMPENVIPNLSNPILLADYLTSSYNIGGSIAVLALESLFILIVEHNLDYPKFFESLYRLCTYEVFSAKYRSKFMKLLHRSLQSTNLPSYTVAAFCRRLMSLALIVNTPSAMFLQSQCLWLLKRHTSCLKLVHDNENKESKKSSSNYDGDGDHWNAETDDPAQANALASSSSLYETLLLERHYLPDAADLATSLRHSSTTRPNNVRAPQNESHADQIRSQTAENVQDYIGGIWNSYADVMDNQLAAAKVGQGAALSMNKPQTVIASDALISGCFSGH